MSPQPAQPNTPDQEKEHVIRQLVKRLTVLESRSYHDDEQGYVDDTQLFFNQPHVISAIVLVVLGLLWLTWTQSSVSSLADNTKSGIFAAIFFFIILGMLTFPTSGPFSKPLPILWRSVFAISVIYEVFLVILLFQTKADARHLMTYLDPTTGTPLIERSYAEACEFTWENIRPNIFDRFAVAHFLGWFVKSMIIRDVKLCWIISIGWEFIEILFTPLLPNFAECWWDQWLLDVMICNGLGIFAGVWVQHHFKMMSHNWFEVYSSPIYLEKTQRLLKKYNLSHLITNNDSSKNESFSAEKWGFSRSIKRFFGIQFIILVCQTQELNAFFLKQLLWLPPESYLNPARLFLWMLFSIPCVRQFYLYMTNPHVKTLGRQAFLSIIIMVTELMIIFKFSEGEFTEPYPTHLKQLIAILATGYILYNAISIYLIYTEQPTNDVHRAALKSLDNKLAADENKSLNVFDVMDHVSRNIDHDGDDDDYDCDLYPLSPRAPNQHIHHNKHKKRSEMDEMIAELHQDVVIEKEIQSNHSSFYDHSVLLTPTKSPTKIEAHRNALIKFTPNTKAPEPPACQPQTSNTSMVSTKDLYQPSGRFSVKKQQRIFNNAINGSTSTTTSQESEQHRHFRMLLKQKRAEGDGVAIPPSPRRNFVRKPVNNDDFTTDDELKTTAVNNNNHNNSQNSQQNHNNGYSTPKQQQYNNDTTGNSSSDAEMDFGTAKPQARTVRGTPRRAPKQQHHQRAAGSDDDNEQNDDEDEDGVKRRPSRTRRE